MSPPSAWQQLRGEVLRRVEAGELDADDRERAAAVVAGCVRGYQDRAQLDEQVAPLGDPEAMIARLVEAVCDYGPLTALLADGPDNPVEEVLIQGSQIAYLTSDGQAHRLTVTATEEELAGYVQRLLQQAQVSVAPSPATPMVSAGLPGRLRISCMVPPVVEHLDVAIRRMVLRRPTLAALLEQDMLSVGAASLLWALMQVRCRLAVAGETGAGKTTLLDALLAAVDPRRVVRVVELARELSTPLALGGYAQACQGTSLRELVCWQLRFRPWLLVIGEVLGGEAFDVMRALNAGSGFACSVHANSAKQAVGALTRAALLAGEGVPEASLRRAWAEHLEVVVFCEAEQAAGTLRRQVTQIACVSARPDGHVHYIPLYLRPEVGKPLLWTYEPLPEELAGRVERILPEGATLQAVLEGRHPLEGLG